MTPYRGGVPIPSDDDEYEDYIFQDATAGTVIAKRNKRTGHIVFEGGTVNPGYEPQVNRMNPAPFHFTDTITNFRPVMEYLEPDDPHDIEQACIEWAAVDKSTGPSLEEFLAGKFGLNNGILRMNPSTFKKCLQRAHKKGLIAKGNNGRWKPK